MTRFLLSILILLWSQCSAADDLSQKLIITTENDRSLAANAQNDDNSGANKAKIEEKNIFTTQDANYAYSKNLQQSSKGEITFDVYDTINMNNVELPDCTDKHLNFLKCEPGICKTSSSFGNIYSKIKGKTEDKCIYIERTAGIDGINCSIPVADLVALQPVFEHRFMKLSRKLDLLNQKEQSLLRNTFLNHCTNISDHTLSSLVMIYDRGIENIDPEFTTDDLEQYSNAIFSKPKVPDQAEKGDGDPNAIAEETSELDMYKSIMFTKDEVDLLNLLLQTAGGKKTAQANTPAAQVYGNFYLSSIIYVAEAKWTLWLNSKQYRSDNKDEVFVFEEVTPDYVKVKWAVGSLDRISPAWRSKLTQLSNGKFVSKQFGITVSGQGENMFITFKLRPNQTFNAIEMTIFEGHI